MRSNAAFLAKGICADISLGGNAILEGILSELMMQQRSLRHSNRVIIGPAVLI
jgi:hypothetical protein